MLPRSAIGYVFNTLDNLSNDIVPWYLNLLTPFDIPAHYLPVYF